MAKQLSQTITNQITAKAIGRSYIFKINGVDFTSYLKTWSLSFDTKFGSATGTFTLNNSSSNFGNSGVNEIKVGHVVELIEYFDGDATAFKKFYGTVEQRSISKKHNTRDITLNCLDYIAVLQNWNLNLTVEGTKEKVTNEEMEPVYLPEPQDSMASLFNFANNSIATKPLPFIKFQDRNQTDFTDDQFDGYEIYYDVGQMKLGAPLNVLYNYKVLATYYHYTRGLYVEDVIEAILIEPDGYGNYLFGESTAQAVIDNHLIETFQNVEGVINDTLSPNLVPLEVTVEHQLTQDFEPIVTADSTLSEDYLPNEEGSDRTIMYIDDSTDFELESGSGFSGTAKLGDRDKYILTYTGTGTDSGGDYLTGVSISPIEKNFPANTPIKRITEIENTELYVDDVAGFPEPSSGNEFIQIQVNGDITYYNSITPVSGGGYILGGIGESGGLPLKNKAAGSYVKYIDTYAAGTIWALRYNNIQTDLVDANFIYPSGYTGELLYVDKRLGRIILSETISGYTNDLVYCSYNYEFKTLQATGIELNSKIFREREVENRMEGIKELKKYLAPNYIIRTIGDNKIWSSYLNQKTVADYDLNLITGLDYMEDSDLFTRVKMWTKNENPTNIMFGDNVDYIVDDEDAYTGVATKEELMYMGDERSGELSQTALDYLTELETFKGSDPTGDVINFLKEKYIDKEYASQPTTGMRIYATPISNEYGKLILENVTPTIWINGVPIDNQVHRLDQVPIKIYSKVKTITEGGGKSKSVSTTTYYYYIIYFPHTSIVPTEKIEIYDVQGVLMYTIEANDPNMNYGDGIYTFPGQEENEAAARVSSAGYHVLYDSSLLEINYEDVVFKIDKSLVLEPTEQIVRGTFEYWSIAIGIRDIQLLVDGRRDTQLQLQFYGEPLSGFHLATLDLGEEQTIQALDIIGGFFRPDDYRKFDVNFTASMQYSLDGINFYAISDKTEQFQIEGGASVTFEEEDLGIGFSARYLKFNLYDVQRLNYGKGRYVVAMTEISAYNDIVIEAEATLIPTTTLAQELSTYTPLCHLKLNDDLATTDIIDSTGTYDVTLEGGSNTSDLSTTGKIDEALELNGIADRINCGDIYTENKDAFSFSIWIYCNGFNSDSSTSVATPIISNWNTWSPGSQKGFALRTWGNDAAIYWSFTVCDGVNYNSYSFGTNDITTFNTLYANKWLNIVCTFDKNESKISVSFDKVEVKTGTALFLMIPDLTSSVYVGWGGVNSNYFDGKIDDVRFYDFALSTSQIEYIYNSGAGESHTVLPSCIYLTDTTAFTEPESGEDNVTAYLNKEDSFTYTDIESGNVLSGCTFEEATTYPVGAAVTQALSGDTSIYDEDYLLPTLGDRLSKEKLIDDRNLYSQAETNALAKAFLIEYYKDHTKAKVDVIYSPHLQVGQTVSVTDSYNNISDLNYFIESISESARGVSSLVLARYPAT